MSLVTPILCFNTLWTLLPKTPGVGGGTLPKMSAPRTWTDPESRGHALTSDRHYRWPDATGNTVCCDGGIGTSPLRSRQRMEFNTSLLASSAWCQFIMADAFAPAAVGALLLKMSPL
jgi:hypothetical protein